MRDAALVLFSSGQDSATCLAWALERYLRVETIGFDYGQRHAVELAQRGVLLDAMAGLKPLWRERLGADQVVDLSGYGALAESALTADRAIALAADGVPTTFVPGRNLVFLAVAAAYAYRRGIGVLVGGMCEADYSGYPDCRRAALDAMQQALSLGLAAETAIETPLMRLTKAQTWTLAHDLGGDALVSAIVEHSHTCYLGDRTHRHEWGYGCGTCPACMLRESGWRAWRQSQLRSS
ncbi:MAG: 7-cyano-7-deazaguanine synthase QueC [Hyphomonadaceae bacterium]|nr:7-cyano-7-deazaguanine synthase QueC [Hyphomonadaceae bacterium]